MQGLRPAKLIEVKLTMQEWARARQMQVKLPKSTMDGTVQIHLSGLHGSWELMELWEELRESNVKVVDMYMFTNKENGKFTGRINAAVEPTREVVEMLDNRRRLMLRQVRARIEVRYNPKRCWNCFRIGHSKEECKVSKKCRKCGQEGHLAKECQQTQEVRSSKCGFCKEDSHGEGQGCAVQVKDRREARQKERELPKKEPMINMVYAKKAEERENKNKEQAQVDKDNFNKNMAEMIGAAVAKAMETAMTAMATMMLEHSKKQTMELREFEQRILTAQGQRPSKKDDNKKDDNKKKSSKKGDNSKDDVNKNGGKKKSPPSTH
jgi:hypothetical protein